MYTLSKETEANLSAIITLVQSRWTLGDTHGISHWKRVRENGKKLLDSNVDPVVVQFFAYLHDSCRQDDFEDLHHGVRAAEWISSIRDLYLQCLTDEQIEKLKTACRLHTVTQRTGDPTVDACFDADRLDLWRVGILPDPKKMATSQGAKMAKAFSRSW